MENICFCFYSRFIWVLNDEYFLVLVFIMTNVWLALFKELSLQRE